MTLLQTLGKWLCSHGIHKWGNRRKKEGQDSMLYILTRPMLSGWDYRYTCERDGCGAERITHEESVPW